MMQEKVSGVGIVDKDGKLIGHLSASDINGIKRDTFGDLLLDTFSFQEKYGLRAKQPVIVCMNNSTLESVIMKMSLCNIHSIWLVDEEGHPKALLTLNDILKVVHELISNHTNT